MNFMTNWMWPAGLSWPVTKVTLRMKVKTNESKSPTRSSLRPKYTQVSVPSSSGALSVKLSRRSEWLWSELHPKKMEEELTTPKHIVEGGAMFSSTLWSVRKCVAYLQPAIKTVLKLSGSFR